MSWREGDRLTHRFNPELGPGSVVQVDGRFVVVQFPSSETVLRLAANSDALVPLVFRPGAPVRVISTGRSAVVESLPEAGRVQLSDGAEVDEDELWPIDLRSELIGRLITGDIDHPDAFKLRIDTLELEALREADDISSFLGGRIHLFPHQLYVAERATRSDPVRWLLADEVGLGKTVESCLILNHLIHTGRASRVLVVAPETLTVQWLGELWRKYHQVFVLLDEKRLEDVEKDYGDHFNPFDAHDRAVVSEELLVERPRLAEQAVATGVDLLIADEAHHLRRAPGHPGNPAYRAIAPIADAAKHVLLLTAIPLEDDLHGFFRLLQILRPDQLDDYRTFDKRLSSGEGLPPCTSATRRIDIGGLPPRVGRAVAFDQEATAPMERLLASLRRGKAQSTMAKRAMARRIRRAMSSPAALMSLPEVQGDSQLAELATDAERKDPRIDWIVQQIRRWLESGDKTLIFVAHRETLDFVKRELNRRAHLRTGVFHEQLSTKQRDIEVAQFRSAAGPAVLISTECGGEGRNFEFCERLVLFDLPWNPLAVEQRIGRLDRIGRTRPVEIVYFKPAVGLGNTVASLYEELGLYRRPMSSLEHELAGVEPALEVVATAPPQPTSQPERAALVKILEETERAYDRVQRAAYHQLHRHPYRPGMAQELLARVPEQLETLTRETVLGACHALGLHVEEHRSGSRHSIELDSRAKVESLPGLKGEMSYLGTFSRELAVANEELDFFSFGHPLVEGLLAHLEEDPIGRVGLLRAPVDAAQVSEANNEVGERGFGLAAWFKKERGLEMMIVDSRGQERPDWRERLEKALRDGPRVRPKEWVEQSSWPNVIRRLGAHLEGREQPVALAFFRIG